ncbi:MAG: GntR family transcriptional regulator [Eubacteriales bacterium]|nr:GntR family transcriptional regulator [Eubacteriales bacterium]
MAIFQHTIDKKTPIPLYYQLKQIIVSEIEAGVYKPGDLIPTEKELSEFFDISRTTVRQAITELVQEGRLYRVKSKGTFVTRPKISQDFIRRIETFNEQITRLGMSPSTQLLELKTITAPEVVQEQLRLPPGSKVLTFLRKRYADDEPNVIVRTYLPYDTCGFVADHDLEQESLYEILAKDMKTRIFRISRVVEAVLADSRDAEILGISAGTAVHFFTSVGYNQDNQPIEYSLARYRGDRNRFEVDVYYTPPNQA